MGVVVVPGGHLVNKFSGDNTDRGAASVKDER